MVATVPAFRVCVSQGRMRDEALANIREAAELWIEAQNDMHGSNSSGTVEEHRVPLG